MAVLVMLGLVWLLYSGLRARSELDAVRDLAHRLESQIRTGDDTGARATAQSLRDHAASAHDYASGFVWAIGADIPYAGDPLDSVRTLATGADDVARTAVPPLIAALGDFRGAGNDNGSVDIEPLVRLLPRVGTASHELDATLRHIQAAPASTWLGSVDTARREALTDLAPIATAVGSVAAHQDAIRTLLGMGGTRNYLVAIQDDAEIRPTGGGLPGSFAVLRADHGRLSFTTFEPDSFLGGVPSRGLDLGPDFDNLYPGARKDFQDANASPHYPYAAEIWAQVWADKTGTPIDGVLSLDPTTLKYLLAVSGPVTAPDGTEVSAGNVVALTQKTLYEKFQTSAQSAARKRFLVGISKAVANHLLDVRNGLGAFTHALKPPIDQHRLLFWTRDANVESWVASGDLGGTMPDDSQPYVAVALNNDSQSKLDYYLHASFDYTSTCQGSVRDVTATVTLHNDAPANLPQYVLGNSSAGSENLFVGMYATQGAKFGTVTDHGKLPFNLRGEDRGHPVYIVYATIRRGESDVIVYHWAEPVQRGQLDVRDQPMINPMTTRVSYQPCS